LREELEQLNAEIIEANEERAQAAEYGLVVLEEKQALQYQYDELNSLYDSTKRELENSANVRLLHALWWMLVSCDTKPTKPCNCYAVLLV